MNGEAYQAIAISLGVGLLVGLQREWKESDIAGIRTFPLITLLGTFCALIGGPESYWVIAAGMLAVVFLLLIANLAKLKANDADPGITTEVAALLMFGIGAALGTGLIGPAIVASGVVAVLLHWKQRLHGLVDRIGEKDLRSVIHLVLIGLVILPMLPDKTFDPYEVINPYKIWLMVVLIVGISMAAYVIYRYFEASLGAVLGGILGGLISSTATTVSYSRQTKGNPDGSSVAALVIIIASAIANVRVLFEIGVVAPQLLQTAILPIGLLTLLMAGEAVVLFIPLRGRESDPPNHDNPAQLKAAIVFGALYAVMLFIVAAAKHNFGNRALYGVAAISGLTDVDAMTLSAAKLFSTGSIEATTAWRLVMVAILSNLVFKAGAVAVLGSKRLLAYTSALLGIAFAAGLALILLWPNVDIPFPESMQAPAKNSAQPATP